MSTALPQACQEILYNIGILILSAVDTFFWGGGDLHDFWRQGADNVMLSIANDRRGGLDGWAGGAERGDSRQHGSQAGNERVGPTTAGDGGRMKEACAGALEHMGVGSPASPRFPGARGHARNP